MVCHGRIRGALCYNAMTNSSRDVALYVPLCSMSSVAEQVDNNSDDEMDAVDDSLTFHDDADSPTEKGLVGALRSLERTISAHCQLLGRRLTREPTAKPTQAPPLAETVGVGRPSVSGPVLPKAATHRGDKVSAAAKVDANGRQAGRGWTSCAE